MTEDIDGLPVICGHQVDLLFNLVRPVLAPLVVEMREIFEADQWADVSLVVQVKGRDFYRGVRRTGDLPENLKEKFGDFLKQPLPGPCYVRVLGADTGIARWLAPDGDEADENPAAILHAVGFIDPVMQS